MAQEPDRFENLMEYIHQHIDEEERYILMIIRYDPIKRNYKIATRLDCGEETALEVLLTTASQFNDHTEPLFKKVKEVTKSNMYRKDRENPTQDKN